MPGSLGSAAAPTASTRTMAGKLTMVKRIVVVKGLLMKSGVMNPEYDQVGRCCNEQ